MFSGQLFMSEPDGFMLSLVWVAPVSFGSARQPPARHVQTVLGGSRQQPRDIFWWFWVVLYGLQTNLGGPNS